jgi:hypothetical protein
MVWTDLKDIQVPLRVGDVVILPGMSILHFPCDALTNSNGLLTWSR